MATDFSSSIVLLFLLQVSDEEIESGTSIRDDQTSSVPVRC